MTRATLPVDPGLLERFRAAGARIVWRPVPPSRSARPVRRVRVAHLHDEDARVESWGRDPGGGVEVDSGPVGALVVLLEADRRRRLPSLASRDSGVDRAFPHGAIVATWGRPSSSTGPTVRDLVELARYALA